VLRDLAYGLYSRKLRRELTCVTLPAHVGLIMGGNRRWARQMGPVPAWGTSTGLSKATATSESTPREQECAGQDRQTVRDDLGQERDIEEPGLGVEQVDACSHAERLPCRDR
jgi:hypothetical protein